jgi:hypothetical protein
MIPVAALEALLNDVDPPVSGSHVTTPAVMGDGRDKS